MGSGWRPKSTRMLASIGKKNVVAARRHVGMAWREVEEMKMVLIRLKRTRPLKPLSAS